MSEYVENVIFSVGYFTCYHVEFHAGFEVLISFYQHSKSHSGTRWTEWSWIAEKKNKWKTATNILTH